MWPVRLGLVEPKGRRGPSVLRMSRAETVDPEEPSVADGVL